MQIDIKTNELIIGTTDIAEPEIALLDCSIRPDGKNSEIWFI
jgi:hypothetical protein